MARARGLQQGEKLVIRTQSGRFTKFRSDRKLIYEIRSSKTNKFVRFLFPEKKKVGKKYVAVLKNRKPIAVPKKITPIQFKFLTVRRKSRGVAPKIRNHYGFMLHAADFILNQIFEHRKEIIGMIRGALRKENIVGVYADISPDDGSNFRTSMVMVGKNWSDDDILKTVAMELIINTFRANEVRMSPKKGDRKKRKKQPKQAWVDLYVAKF